jgi:hypothetical protein
MFRMVKSSVSILIGAHSLDWLLGTLAFLLMCKAVYVLWLLNHIGA